MRTHLTPHLDSAAILSIGGAFIRIWRAGSLQVELPNVVIWDTRTGQYTSFGTEAAELEEKLPVHLHCIRPFFTDELYDRQALQAILRHAIDLDRNSLSLVDRFLAPLRYEVHVSPTITPLHAKWLRQAGWEVGIWPWRVRSPLARVITPSRPRSVSTSQAHLYGVIDLGFSATRVYCGVEETVLLAARSPHGLQSFCQQLSEYVLATSGLRFPPTVFYDQRWFVKHPVFDEQKQQARLEMVTKKQFETVLEAYGKQLSSFIVHHMSQLPDVQRAHLQQRGWILVGGGAKLNGLAELLQNSLGMPVQIDKYVPYSEFPHG